jgi:hypothetical protein
MNPGTDWIEQGRRLLQTLRDGLDVPAGAEGEHSADCRWCPVCQAAAVVRGERPEITAALADVLATAATALRTFADAGADAPAADPEADAEAGGEGDSEGDGDPPAVQRIEIA